ncbi:MAG: CoA transferase [Dehalococcoidia bacterium]|nr:CoA transferase [Dehalococcoidia bacterium]MDW8120336.1 CoA transferase [Chloroflexota bacterium]
MPRLPLEGIRIVDITVVWAGPYACFLLAHLGAEVIRVESIKFFQPLTRGPLPRPPKAVVQRGQPPWIWGMPNRDPGQRPWNRSPMFNSHASNKLSMTVDLRVPKGKEILARLVKISDVVIENNVTETMDKMGITYDWLRSIKPDIIFVRMPALGNTGKYANYRLLGSMNEGVAGHNTLRGYPDMDPTAVTPVYAADAASGAGAAFAVLAALHYRQRTGKGQLVELSQIENFMPYLGQAILDYTMNGRVQRTLGNRHPWAIQGVYRCKGEDRWCAITIFNDDQFVKFCQATGHPEWATDPRFADAISRYKHHDDLDKLIESWTSLHTPYEVFHLLQRAGVPAGPVMDQRDAYNDPHLQARGFFKKASQEDCGEHLYPGAPFTMSATPPTIRRGPVRLGQDNEYVYKTLLKFSDAEYQQLIAEGHIGTELAPDVVTS